jgi:hypothetical protein
MAHNKKGCSPICGEAAQTNDTHHFTGHQQRSNRQASDNMVSNEHLTGATMQAIVEALAEHGLDPMTLPQAAAHEAGHLLIGLAIGNTFRSCRVHRVSGYWGGYTETYSPRLHTDGPFAIEHDPARAFWLAAVLAGGIGGETMAGLCHPSSSVDERVQLAHICKGLLIEEDAILRIVRASLEENAMQFSVACSLLRRNRRITRTDAERILARIRPVDTEGIRPLYSRRAAA